MPRTLIPIEGNSQRLDGGAMFGHCPRPVWEKWMAPDERHRILLACRSLLIVEENQVVLLEAGIGQCFEPRLAGRFGVQGDRHLLLDRLAEAGLTDADIDVVVLSHLHFDHAGGLLAPWKEGAPPRLLFPRARFLVGRRAWERALAPHDRDRASFLPELPGLLGGSGRLELVEAGPCPALGPGYRFHESDGHTPGMMLTELDTPEGPLVYTSDLIPMAPWMHLPVTMGYDRHSELVVEEKRALLEDLLRREGRVIFTHDPEIGIARVAKDERGRFFAAA